MTPCKGWEAKGATLISATKEPLPMAKFTSEQVIPCHVSAALLAQIPSRGLLSSQLKLALRCRGERLFRPDPVNWITLVFKREPQHATHKRKQLQQSYGLNTAGVVCTSTNRIGR